MALFDCFLWNCIKLAPLRAAWNVSPDAIISVRMILFAHSSAKPPNQCDYSFWYFAWAHRSFLCSVHVHIHKDLLDSFLVSSSREVWVHCFFAIERQKTSQLLRLESCLVFCWCRWLRKRVREHFLDRSLLAACAARHLMALNSDSNFDIDAGRMQHQVETSARRTWG